MLKLPRRALLLAALSLALIGCKTEKKPPTGPDTFVILIDKSASITPAQQTDYTNYLTSAVLPSITPDARVIIETIVGANTHGDPTQRVIMTMPHVSILVRDLKYNLIKGDFGADKACKNDAAKDIPEFLATRARVQSQVLAMLRSKQYTSSNTYLIDGMREASEMMERKPGRGVLYVLSDGLEDSDEFGPGTKFDSKLFWSKHRPEYLVRQVDPASIAPGLKGTRVYFYGLATGENRAYQKVRGFWQAFFRAAKVESSAVGHGGPDYSEPRFDPTPDSICGQGQFSILNK